MGKEEWARGKRENARKGGPHPPENKADAQPGSKTRAEHNGEGVRGWSAGPCTRPCGWWSTCGGTRCGHTKETQNSNGALGFPAPEKQQKTKERKKMRERERAREQRPRRTSETNVEKREEHQAYRTRGKTWRAKQTDIGYPPQMCTHPNKRPEAWEETPPHTQT